MLLEPFILKNEQCKLSKALLKLIICYNSKGFADKIMYADMRMFKLAMEK